MITSMETYNGKYRIEVRVVEPSVRKIKEVISDFPASTPPGSVLEAGRSIRGEQTDAEVTFAIIENATIHHMPVPDRSLPLS